MQIRPQQKISFRSLIQSMVSLFLHHVEDSHRHEYTLLKEYKDKLFIDGHPSQPYYLAAFLYLNVESLFREKKLPKELRSYKMHIMLLIREMLGGVSPDLASKEIGPYCERLLSALENNGIEACALEACGKFEEIRGKWIHTKGKQYKYGIKDSAEFRAFLMKQLYGMPNEREADNVYTGNVLNVNRDKNQAWFGFIEHTPNNIFFHEFDNPDMSQMYVGKKVSYKVIRNGGGERAICVRLLESGSSV